MCRSMGSPEGRAEGQAHSIPRSRTEGLGDGSRDGGTVLPRPCSDLVTHLGLHLPGPSEEPSWDASGSSSPRRRGEHLGVALKPTGLLHRAPSLWFSTCGACEHHTGSHTWSPGQEARDPGPGKDPKTSPKSLPTCCRAFCTLLSKPPLKTFLSASDSDSDSLSASVSLRLQLALPFLPEDVRKKKKQSEVIQFMSDSLLPYGL